MKKVQIKIDCLNLGNQSIKKLNNYFIHMDADNISMEDNYLVIHLKDEITKETKWFIFMQDIEYLVNLKPRTAYKDKYIYVYF